VPSSRPSVECFPRRDSVGIAVGSRGDRGVSRGSRRGKSAELVDRERTRAKGRLQKGVSAAGRAAPRRKPRRRSARPAPRAWRCGRGPRLADGQYRAANEVSRRHLASAPGTDHLDLPRGAHHPQALRLDAGGGRALRDTLLAEADALVRRSMSFSSSPAWSRPDRMARGRGRCADLIQRGGRGRIGRRELRRQRRVHDGAGASAAARRSRTRHASVDDSAGDVGALASEGSEIVIQIAGAHGGWVFTVGGTSFVYPHSEAARFTCARGRAAHEQPESADGLASAVSVREIVARYQGRLWIEGTPARRLCTLHVPYRSTAERPPLPLRQRPRRRRHRRAHRRR